MIHPLVIGEDRDHLVIDLTSIIEPHDPDDASLYETPWHEWLCDSDDLDIESIIVVIPSAGNSSIGKWVRERTISDSIQLQRTCLGDDLIFVDRHRVDLDEGIESELGLVSKCREDVEEIEHSLRWSDIDIGHECSRLVGW